MAPPSTRLPALVLLVLSLALLAGEIPYALAFGTVLPALPRLETLDDPAPLVPLWSRAVATFPDPRLLSDLALLRMAAARLDPHSTSATWQNVSDSLKAVLDSRPLDPVTWARLSYAETRASNPDAARSAMARSLVTGRYIPGFMQWRYAHALSLWSGMTEDQRRLLAGQTDLLWRKKHWDLIRLSRLGPFADPVESMISTYFPERLDEFLRHRGHVGHTR
jgi:hypothetical protein